MAFRAASVYVEVTEFRRHCELREVQIRIWIVDLAVKSQKRKQAR